MEHDKEMLVARFENNIEKIKERANRELLKNTPILNDLLLTIAKHLFTLKTLASGITKMELERLPELILRNADLIFKSFFSHIEIMDASLNASEDDKRNLLDVFETQYNELFHVISDTKASILFLQDITSSQQIENDRNAAANSLKEMNTMQLKFQEILTKANEQNKDLGIAKYSQVFFDECKRCQKASSIWLAFAIVSFLLVLGFCYALLSTSSLQVGNPDTSLGIALIIQHSVIKLLVTSTLFYAMSVCIKNYRSYKHNETLNRHRQTALQSFEAFSNSPTADDQTKNAVLLAATQAIFGHQHTGYDTSEKDTEMSSKVIEIIRPIKTDG